MQYEIESDGFAKVSGAPPGTIQKLDSLGFAVRGGKTYADGERFSVDLWPESETRPQGSAPLRRALGLPVLVLDQKPVKTAKASVAVGGPPTVKATNLSDKGFALDIATDKAELLGNALRRSGLHFTGPRAIAANLSRFILNEIHVTVEKFANALKGFRVVGPDGQAIVGSFDNLGDQLLRLGGVKPDHLVLGVMGNGNGDHFNLPGWHDE